MARGSPVAFVSAASDVASASNDTTVFEADDGSLHSPSLFTSVAPS
ncbi:hypothetical protein [Halalkalicoccus subterraneus]|nr:hypothetical protein [Halalkalicoccus subterraneus]